MKMRTHHEDTAHEIHGAYRWRTFDGSVQIHDGTAEEAAQAMGLDPAEIEWACEEYGRCDNEALVCWQPNESNGWEWPTAEAP